MFFDGFKLISFDENKDFYLFQKNLVKKYIETNDESLILQVAILLSLPPIADYYESIKVLKKMVSNARNLKACILGAYLMNEYVFNEENCFIYLLKDFLEIVDNEKDKSMIYYLIGKDSKKKNHIKEALVSFEKSIQHGPNFVNNYLELSKLSTSEHKQKYTSIAKLNIKKILSEESISKLGLDYFCSYDMFVDEFILGVVLPEDLYHYYFRKTGNDSPS